MTNQTDTATTLYTMVPNADVVERIPELGKAAVLVYVLLAYHADWKTGRCKPSISSLARKGGFRRTTVCEALGKLESYGLIKVERGKGGAVNKYTLTTLCGSNERDTTPRPDSNERDTQPSDDPATQIVTKGLLEQEPLTRTNKPEREGARKPASAFVKPTLEEVAAYCRERDNKIDPEKFIAHYETVGWVYGKSRTPMKKWKPAIVLWEKSEYPNGGSNGQGSNNHRGSPGKDANRPGRVAAPAGKYAHLD